MLEKDVFTKRDAKHLKELYLRRLISIGCNGSALALSGGTDSITALFGMLELGYKPTIYTFHMKDITSGDLLASRHICKYFALKLREIAIPWDDKTMYEDVVRVIPHCEYIKKTIIQCMIPWMYIYPAMEEETIITGLGGDDLYATQKNDRIKYARWGEAAVIENRRYKGNSLTGSIGNIERLAGRYGKESYSLYNSKEIEEFLLGFTLKAISKPVMKWPSIYAFKQYYDKEPFYRNLDKHNLQINSGLRDCQDLLLKSEYNKRGCKSIIGLYNDIAKGLGKA